MNTKRTSTKADSLTYSTTTRRTVRRVSKLALFRVKVATVVLSMVAFVTCLVSIATYDPRTGTKTTVPVQAPQITIVQSNSSEPLVVAPRPRVTAVRPLVRSRGS